MPLEARFIDAEISEMKTTPAWLLKINYSYYNLYSYTDCFVFGTVDQCIRKLTIERCKSGKLKITNKQNAEVDIDPDK
jgi:hypothetical protein